MIRFFLSDPREDHCPFCYLLTATEANPKGEMKSNVVEIYKAGKFDSASHRGWYSKRYIKMCLDCVKQRFTPLT